MGQIIYGSEVAKERRAALKEKIDMQRSEGRRAPCLAVILAGDNPASLSYVKGKEKACAEVGIEVKMMHLPETVSQQELENNIRQCSEDDKIDGILLQLPLPQGLKENRAIQLISPDKDVDGLTEISVGRLYLNEPGFVPCTPLGIMALLQKMGCSLSGKNAVVIGRSKLVGAPVARLLQNENATVTICHSKTHNLEQVCRQADVLVAAIGRPLFVTDAFVKEGAYVIDVGINRKADGHLCGDVDFDKVMPHVSAITPVPKGVGPMTICMLLENTYQAYESRRQ